MTRLVASRFQIDFSLLELDEWNEPVNEHPQQTVILYGQNAVRGWLEILPDMIEQAEHKLKGAADGANPDLPAAVPRGE